MKKTNNNSSKKKTNGAKKVPKVRSAAIQAAKAKTNAGPMGDRRKRRDSERPNWIQDW